MIAPPLYSHLHALQALAQVLIGRGHRITFILPASAAGLLTDSAITFAALTPANHQSGALSSPQQPGVSVGRLSMRRLIGQMAAGTDRLCCQLPAMLTALSVDGLIVDQMEPAGALVAEALGMPFVSVACALPVNREDSLPLPVMPFDYADTAAARHRYAASQRIYDWLMRGHTRVVNLHARRFGLSPRHGLHDCLSPLAQISQTIKEFDFPRQALPAHFHAVGPLRPPGPAGKAEWPLADSRPRVFASLGTLQGHRFRLFVAITQACRQVGAQLLVAHCGGLTRAQAETLRHQGAEGVTDFADQAALLHQAQAVITHGGMNTVCDAIMSLTPILALPIAFDQPGVAARVVWSGIGRRVSRYSSAATLAANLSVLLSDQHVCQRLRPLQKGLVTAGGAIKAAGIVEQALDGAKPVSAGGRL